MIHAVQAGCSVRAVAEFGVFVAPLGLDNWRVQALVEQHEGLVRIVASVGAERWQLALKDSSTRQTLRGGEDLPGQNASIHALVCIDKYI